MNGAARSLDSVSFNDQKYDSKLRGIGQPRANTLALDQESHVLVPVVELGAPGRTGNVAEEELRGDSIGQRPAKYLHSLGLELGHERTELQGNVEVVGILKLVESQSEIANHFALKSLEPRLITGVDRADDLGIRT